MRKDLAAVDNNLDDLWNEFHALIYVFGKVDVFFIGQSYEIKMKRLGDVTNTQNHLYRVS